jgi:surface carbohydrate biosynthesis protein
MSSRKILILVDHKHRDLPSLSLIGYYLKKLNYKVIFKALWNELELVKKEDFDAVILPKPIYSKKRLYLFKKKNIKIFVINTEGNPQDKKYKMRIQVAPDVMYYWNKSQYELEKNDPIIRNTIKEVIGCPRIDFYSEHLKKVFLSKSELLDKLNLSDAFTITVATSTQDADFTSEQLKEFDKKRQKFLSQTADYYEIVANMVKLRESISVIIKKLSIDYPKINILVKPHPNENISYWNKFIENLSNNNCKLVLGESINSLLNSSDLHISLNVCTTTFEALLCGINCVELHTENSKNLYEDEHLYLSNYVVHNYNELSKILPSIMRKKDTLDLRKKVNLYVNKYFFKNDGMRCIEYSKSINKILCHKIARNGFKYTLLYFIFCFRDYFSFLKNFLLLRKKNTERDRFDNRILNGDEKLYYDIFNNINL